MAVYLVTWDLNKEQTNYAQARVDLISALNDFEHTRDPGLDSVWFISTNWTAQQVSDDLYKHIDKNDRLIVTKINNGTSEHQGWLKEEVWKWINDRL